MKIIIKTNVSCNYLFDKIQPFLKNVVELISINLSDAFNSLDLKSFCSKSTYELENNLKSVSFLNLS